MFRTRLILVLHLPILYAFVFSGCGPFDPPIDSEIAGTWELARIKIGLEGTSGGKSDTSQFVSADEYGTGITLILNLDGSYTMIYTRGEERLLRGGTWRTDPPWLILKYSTGYESKSRYETKDEKLYFGCQGSLLETQVSGGVQSFTYYFEFARLGFS